MYCKNKQFFRIKSIINKEFKIINLFIILFNLNCFIFILFETKFDFNYSFSILLGFILGN